MTACIIDGVEFVCCITVFLPQVSSRSVRGQQHVGGRITTMISFGNRNLRESACQVSARSISRHNSIDLSVHEMSPDAK